MHLCFPFYLKIRGGNTIDVFIIPSLPPIVDPLTALDSASTHAGSIDLEISRLTHGSVRYWHAANAWFPPCPQRKHNLVLRFDVREARRPITARTVYSTQMLLSHSGQNVHLTAQLFASGFATMTWKGLPSGSNLCIRSDCTRYQTPNSDPRPWLTYQAQLIPALHDNSRASMGTRSNDHDERQILDFNILTHWSNSLASTPSQELHAPQTSVSFCTVSGRFFYINAQQSQQKLFASVFQFS